MLYNYSLSYVLNLININKSKKNLYFYILFTQKTLLFLNFFKRNSFIHKYSLCTKHNRPFFKVFIYFYKTKPVCTNFKIISKPSKSFFISYKSLRLLNKRSASSIFVISTSKGILSHQEAIKKKTGGVLLGFFSF